MSSHGSRGSRVKKCDPLSSLHRADVTGRSIRGNVRNNSKNRKKSCFGIPKKNVKKRLKSPCGFKGHLITPVFSTQLPKVSTGKSPTSNIFAQKCGRSIHIHKKLSNLEMCVINVIKVLKCTNK